VTVRCALETVLVCNYCRAETRLDGRRTSQEADAMTFCAAHQRHSEGHGFSLLLPLSESAGVLAISSLPVGTTLHSLMTDGAERPHAALPDMSSLCGAIPAGRLLRLTDTVWGDIERDFRCPECDALT
jgi:hypothetical protein